MNSVASSSTAVLTAEEKQIERIVAVRQLINQREKARKKLDFGRSDFLREKLAKEYGVEVLDQKDGPSGWKFKDGTSRKLPPGSNIPDGASRKAKSVGDAEDPKVADVSNGKKLKDKKRKASDLDATEKVMRDSLSASATNSSVKKVKVKKSSKMVADETGRSSNILEEVTGTSSSDPRGSSSSTRIVQGVTIIDVAEGKGPACSRGDRIGMMYSGRLKNGKLFDSNIGKKPFTFRLGRGEVIRGWDIGCEGMKVGGKRKLIIPPEKAYGRSGAPPTIPGNATLVFEVSLSQIR